TEAEYRSLANSASEVLWIQSLLTELKVPFQVPVMYCTASLSHNPVLHAKTKHMELNIFLRENVIQKHIIVKHTPALDQTADILTKPHSPLRKFNKRETNLETYNNNQALSQEVGSLHESNDNRMLKHKFKIISDFKILPTVSFSSFELNINRTVIGLSKYVQLSTSTLIIFTKVVKLESLRKLVEAP
ncbi:Copia protein, partial [Mucuna pruriens]